MRPCPFCSGTDITLAGKEFPAESLFDDYRHREAYYICEHCGARGSRQVGIIGVDTDGIEERALAAWNGEHK